MDEIASSVEDFMKNILALNKADIAQETDIPLLFVILHKFIKNKRKPFSSLDPSQRKVILAMPECESELDARYGFAREEIIAHLKKNPYKEIEDYGDELKTIFNIICPIGKKELSHLKMPPSHPQNRTAYTEHPLLPSVYFPVASFHRFLFEHKVCEAVRLLMSLGAKTMSVEHVSGWSKEISGKMSLGIAQYDGKASLSASTKESSESKMLFKATLAGSISGSVPADVLWFPNEAGWQQIAEGRMKYGLKEFSMLIDYSDNLGITANLAAVLAGFQIEIGGSFEECQNTTWKIEGTFA